MCYMGKQNEGKQSTYYVTHSKWLHVPLTAVLTTVENYTEQFAYSASSFFKLPHILNPAKILHFLLCSLFQRVVLYLLFRVKGL